MVCVVEFEPDSLWHETSLTIAADALERGTKTEFHVFQHTPGEIREALNGIGVDIARHEKEGRFRIMDSYTPTTPLKASAQGKESFISGTAPNVSGWSRSIESGFRRGFREEEKEWLHIDDNEGILLQYNKEEKVADGWRTTFLPMAKSRRLLALHALVTETASPSYYRKREANADAVIDFRAREEKGGVRSYVRLRVLRGRKFDSRWRRLELSQEGRVGLASVRSGRMERAEVASKQEVRKLAAIMFTDIVGFTELAQRNEGLAMKLLERHRKLLRPIFRFDGGREVKTIGDAFLVEFGSALDASSCAVEVQRALSAYNSGRGRRERIRVRVGIHVGDVIERGDDVLGDAVNIASRVYPHAKPSGICVSQQVVDQIRNKLPYRFSPLGPVDLKNVKQKVSLYRISLPRKPQ